MIFVDQSRNDKGKERWRRYWDKSAASYDKQMGFFERRLFGDSRHWTCRQAAGETLEVASGTGLNLPFYDEQVQLTGIDFSPAMLAIARQRAARLGRPVDLREADALALPFPDARFDTVVCTFAPCAIPDDRGAVAEMRRVLRRAGCYCSPTTSKDQPGRPGRSSGQLSSLPCRCKASTSPAGRSARSRPKDSGRAARTVQARDHRTTRRTQASRPIEARRRPCIRFLFRSSRALSRSRWHGSQGWEPT